MYNIKLYYIILYIILRYYIIWELYRYTVIMCICIYIYTRKTVPTQGDVTVNNLKMSET